MRTKIAQFGLGPIGLRTLQLAAAKPWARIVGGIDIDPAKCGRDLSEITGDRNLRGARAWPSLEALLAGTKPDVIIHTAVSSFKSACEQITPMVQRGISVVSSCEEMVFPKLRNQRLAAELDRLCERHNARVVGTGVNPGFAMDLLPLCLTGVCMNVREIHIRRVVNASTRREPLQRKIGSGMCPRKFTTMLRRGQAGHAGLKESLALLAHGLGWKLDHVTETGKPVVAGRRIQTEFLEVLKGATCGIHQRAEGRVNGRVRLTLDLKMYLDAPEPFDGFRIDGDPPLEVRVPGGIAGDQATVAALVNAVPSLSNARPGLLLPTELAIPRCV